MDYIISKITCTISDRISVNEVVWKKSGTTWQEEGTECFYRIILFRLQQDRRINIYFIACKWWWEINIFCEPGCRFLVRCVLIIAPMKMQTLVSPSICLHCRKRLWDIQHKFYQHNDEAHSSVSKTSIDIKEYYSELPVDEQDPEYPPVGEYGIFNLTVFPLKLLLFGMVL